MNKTPFYADDLKKLIKRLLVAIMNVTICRNGDNWRILTIKLHG